jgi:hypothetical protein
VTTTLQWPTARAAFYVGSLLFYTRAFFLNWERRTRAPDLDSAVAADNRPPVLYLRSFAAEDKTTLWRPKRRKGWASWFAAIGRWLASNIAPQVQSVYLTLEQYISRHVTAWIGPLVALGNPEDRLAPDGAARTYLADAKWQTHFTRHVLAANAVIIEPSPTSSLAWEMRALRENGLATKVFLVLEPRMTVPFGLRSYARLTWRLRGWKLPSWQDVATQLRSTGYTPPDQDPGPGSVITFDEQGRSIVLTTGARSPDALIRPIRRRLYSADGEVAVPDRPSHVLREAALVMTALIACTFATAGARQLLPHGSSPTPVTASAAAAEPAPITAPTTADPNTAETSQLEAINELVRQSAQARGMVVAATGAIQACDSPESVSQAIQQLLQAATIRQRLASQLVQQPVDRIPGGNKLASDLAEAFHASAQSDEYYAAWGNDSLQTGYCDTADQYYQAAQITDQEATNAKLSFAQMWDQEAPQFGLQQLGQGQF